MSPTSLVPQRFTSKVSPPNSPLTVTPVTCPQLASLLEQCRRTGHRLGLSPKHGYIPSARLVRTGYQQAYLPKENEAHTTIVSLEQDKESFLAKKLLLRSVTIDRACYIAAVMIEGHITELSGPTLKDLKMARVEDFLRNSLGIEKLAFDNSQPKENEKSLEMVQSELREIQVVDTLDCSMIVHPATPCKERCSEVVQEESGCGIVDDLGNTNRKKEERKVENESVTQVMVGDQMEDFEKCSKVQESYRNERHLSFQEIETKEALGSKCEIDNESGFATENIENQEIQSRSETDRDEQIIESEILSPSVVKVNTERLIDMDIVENVKRKEAISQKEECFMENVKENVPKVQTFDKEKQLTSNMSRDDASEDNQSELSMQEGDAEEALVLLVTPRPEDSVCSLREEVLSDFSWFDCSSVTVTQVVGRLEVRVEGDRELGLAALVGLETKYSIGFKPQVESMCCIILYTILSLS